MSSASSIVFAGTPVEPCAEYKLVANNSFKNIKLNNSGNTYYYAFVPADNAFKLITGETTIRPFEAYIAVTVDNPDTSLRSSFAVDDTTPILQQALQINDPVVSERYYNLQGIEIYRPADQEIHIVCRTLKSGVIKTVKRLNNNNKQQTIKF
jgi:hypothetical protein